MVKPVKVLAPVTERVPPVFILVLIVVAAETETAIKNIEKSRVKIAERVPPPCIKRDNLCISINY